MEIPPIIPKLYFCAYRDCKSWSP